VGIIVIFILLITVSVTNLKAQDNNPPPPAVRDIIANSYYIDSAHSIIDPELKAENDAAVKPIEDYLSDVSKYADRYITHNDTVSGICAVKWLQTWGEQKALLGQVSGAQAEYERKWALAGLALAYLKVKPLADPEQKKAIESWLKPLSNAVRKYTDIAIKHPENCNNHYYWAGLAIGATGLATHTPSDWDYAKHVFDEAVESIRPDGTLLLELKRGKMALSYHSFAAAPLVMLAELARLKGEGDWYVKNDNALHRLVTVTVKGIRDPRIFQNLTGVKQEDNLSNERIQGWIAIYDHHFPDRGFGQILNPQKHYVYPRLGGDLTVLADNLSKLNVH
jgi:poly(beta-D-mannuronate) lyase